MSNNEDDLLAKIQEMEEGGASEQDIENYIKSIEERDDQAVQLKTVVPTIEMRYDDLPEYNPFKEKPDKPDFFELSKKPVKTHRFHLKPKGKYTLRGQERNIRKMNMRDMVRLAAKIPHWSQYLSFNTPEMLVDEITGKFRITETLLKLFERAFGDYDHENDCPTDFSLSVIDEVARLLNHDLDREKIDAEYLLESDAEEVFEAVEKLIEANKGFFMKAWNKAGAIRNVYSLISGVISSKVNNLREMMNLESNEESQNPSEI